MNVDTDHFDALRGTSTAKIAALLQHVRDDGKTSMVLGLLERMPFGVGDVTKFLLYDVPTMEPQALDAILDKIANVILVLKSDEHVTSIECVECEGECVLDPCDENEIHEHRASCTCGWVHTNSGVIVCDIKAGRHTDAKARGDRGPISDEERSALPSEVD